MRTFQPFDSRIIILLIAAVAIASTLGALRPDVFLSALNINSMLLQSSVIGLLALAVAVTMLTGGIDLSINATANLTAIVVALVVGAVTSPDDGGIVITLAGMAVGLLVGLCCGLFNGFLIAILGYSPILATLGTMTLFAGIGTVFTGGSTLFGIQAFASIGRGSFLGIPLPAFIFIGVAIVLTLVLEARRFGFFVYLIGANPAAARYCGIDARQLIFRVYGLSGLLSAVAGLLNLGITNSANVDSGTSYVLLAILIVVLGGISPSGGVGRIMGVVLAVLILQFLSTGLNLMFQSSGSNFLKEFAWGSTLLVVLALGSSRWRRSRRRKQDRAAVGADATLQA